MDDLRARKAELEAQYGPWTAHNLRLAEDVYTISPAPTGDEQKLRRVLQIVADLAQRPIDALRVLDLACLEGMYALEFAARGARVVAIEGREANLAKARFAAEALDIDGIDFQLGDVRDLDPARHGTFDVVLCLGILYHLDAPDVFDFVASMRRVCTDLLVVDTHASPAPRESRTHDGVTYFGESLLEHEETATEDERLDAAWSSLDNPKAFAPTRASLLNLLGVNGFSSVHECLLPPEPDKPRDRITYVARAGGRLEPRLTPAPPPWAPLPEEAGRSTATMAESLRANVPPGVKRTLRRLAGRPTPPRR
jgi:SAM-dependent methyltransferase